MVRHPYLPVLAERGFEVAIINARAQPRDMQVVARVVAPVLASDALEISYILVLMNDTYPERSSLLSPPPAPGDLLRDPRRYPPELPLVGPPRSSEPPFQAFPSPPVGLVGVAMAVSSFQARGGG